MESLSAWGMSSMDLGPGGVKGLDRLSLLEAGMAVPRPFVTGSFLLQVELLEVFP